MHYRLPLILLLCLTTVAAALDPKSSDALVTGPKPAPITAPTQREIQDAIDRGVAFLVKRQNKDGSWGAATQTKGLNILAAVPGSHLAFRAAVTAMSVSTLIETGPATTDARAALERGEAWLVDNLPKVRRADQTLIYNVWSHAYGIQALVRMHNRLPDDKPRQEKIKGLIQQQISMLQRYETVDGGWGYYDFDVGSQRPAASSTSFVTATVLVAFHEARQIGIDPPAPVLARAIASIRRQRNSDFTYIYGEYLKYRPTLGINRAGGSLGRSQACNIAMRLWGDKSVTDHVMKVWLDRLYARNDWLSIGRKRPVPHEAWFQVAGYFYYYGHYYAALCIDDLPKAERPHFQQHLARIIIDLQEKDGSWWDFPFYDYHQQYGTAFAVMTLQRCRAIGNGK